MIKTAKYNGGFYHLLKNILKSMRKMLLLVKKCRSHGIIEEYNFKLMNL
jgi:hypothetical protein